MRRDCEIMMTLNLDFWLTLFSREEFSFRNAYVSFLVGAKQLYTQKWFINTDQNQRFKKITEKQRKTSIYQIV